MKRYMMRINKNYTATGAIVVMANDIDEARDLVEEMIDDGEIKGVIWEKGLHGDENSIEVTGEGYEIK